MNDNEEALIVCSTEDAALLLAKNPEFRASLVIVTADGVLNTGQMIMVPKEEFIEYLHGGVNDG